MNPRTADAFLRIGLVCALGALAVHVLLAWTVLGVVARGGGIGDWVSIYAAGTIVRLGDGANLFDASVQESVQRTLFGPDANVNVYPLPAFFAIAIAPVTRLSFAESYMLWLCFNVTLLGALLIVACRWLAARRVRSWRAFGFLAATSFPVVNLLLLGQVDLLIIASFAASYVLQQRGQRAAAGAVLALALIKPHLVAAPVLMLLAQRQWRTLGAFSVGSGALIAIPAIVFDPASLLDQIGILGGSWGASTEGRINAPMMVNLRGLIVSITGATSIWAWTPLWLAAASASAVAAVRFWRASHADRELSWSLAFVLPLIWSPHLHAHSLVFLLGALAFYLHARPPAGSTAAIVMAWGYSLITVLWLASLAGVSLLALLVFAAFAFILRLHPDAGRASAGRSPAAAPPMDPVAGELLRRAS